MFQGFIKTAAATPKVIPGDVDFNVSEIIDRMMQAEDEGVKLLAFPELCITGASCQDLFKQERLLEAAVDGLQQIIDASVGLDVLTLVGLPYRMDGRIYDVTAAVRNGTILGMIPSASTSDTDALHSSRYFTPYDGPARMIETELFHGYGDEDDDGPEDGEYGLNLVDEDDDLMPLTYGDLHLADSRVAEEDEEEDEDPDAPEVIGVIGPDDEDDDEDWAEDAWDDVWPFDDDDDWDNEDWDGDWDEEDSEAFLAIHARFGTDLIFTCPEYEGLRIGVITGGDPALSFYDAQNLAADGATVIVHTCAAFARADDAAMESAELKTAAFRNRAAILKVGAGPSESTTDGIFSGVRALYENEEQLFFERLDHGYSVSDIDFHAVYALRKTDPMFMPEGDEETPGAFQKDMAEVMLLYTEHEQLPLQRKIDRNPYMPGSRKKTVAREILELQALALSKRMTHTGSKRMLLGLSGGLDSTLALLVMLRAAELSGRGKEQILCLTMPAFGTSDQTKSNAVRLAEAAGVELREINIKDSLLQHFRDIGHPVDVHDAAFENAQARERTQILLDLANMEQGIVVGTGDLSESALGWCTYNGDHMSSYAVNANLPKTVIREVVKAYADTTPNADLKSVLLDILATPVSPELLPADRKGKIAQKTEDLIGPYELHDFFLYRMLKYQESPQRIAFLAEQAFGRAYRRREILKWLEVFYRRFFVSQFKRNCSVDGPQIFAVGLGPRESLKLPSDASGALWIEEVKILEEIEDLYEG